MNANQILAVCMAAMLAEDQITGYQIEEISDEEACLILKIVSEGNHHLDYRHHTIGSNAGKFYPMPVANSNVIHNDSAAYNELCKLWAIVK